jgi:1-acyl-sn-glycerol-3-phosphate acyltransferase
MQTIPSSPPKPVNEVVRPEITRLPVLTVWRRVFRRVILWLLRIIVRLCVRCSISGRENIPTQGAALLVSNHLGDADMVVGLAFAPKPVEFISKAEMYDYPVVGKLMDAYGVIWVHRGQPDRRALRAALQGLSEGRMVTIAPEGRESLSGALEEGTRGAAYLALKASVPVIPVTVTGTENRQVYGNIKRFKRTEITLTVGQPFRLDPAPDQKQALQQGTLKIMHKLAEQLPVEYRGYYSSDESLNNDADMVEADG